MNTEEAEYVVIGESFAGISAALSLASRDRVVLLDFHRDTDAIVDLPRVQSTSLHRTTTGVAFEEVVNSRLKRAGIERQTSCYITSVKSARNVIVECTEQRWSCKGVVFAPNGTEPGLGASSSLHGFGVSYSAGSDASFYRGRRVAVYGDAPRAIEHAWIAAQYASEVLVLLKGSIAQGDAELINDLRSSSAVTFNMGVIVHALRAGDDGTLSSIDIETPTARRAIDVDALFVAQHLVPATDVIRGECADGIVLAGLAAGIDYWNHPALVNDGVRAAHTLLAVRS